MPWGYLVFGAGDCRVKTGYRILLVDDDGFFLQYFEEYLRDRGYEVATARDVATAKEMIANFKVDLAIIDVMLPLGDLGDGDDADFSSARGGFESGVLLARWILKNYPGIKFVGHSMATSRDVAEWFEEHGSGFIHKRGGRPDAVVDRIAHILADVPLSKPKAFIVHGHAEGAKYELKNYLQNILGFPEPVILHEQPSLGRTIIEKFEEESADIELVFVLLTPDDVLAPSECDNEQKRRARQNVILELGYFLAKMGRKSGKVLLLHKGPIELPSDISGLIYIDISHGIELAGEAIRRELSPLLKQAQNG